MRIKIYQIDTRKDTQHKAFMPLADVKNVHSNIYRTVFDGNLNVDSLEDAYNLFNDSRPATYQGHSLSISDVVELIDEDNYKSQFYYCDYVGWAELSKFDTSKCEPLKGIRVVYITPKNKPLDIHIHSDLTSLQNAVDGHISTVTLEDNVFLVCDDEAKLKENRVGNRRIGKSIIAGAFFICGFDGKNFASLPDDKVRKYMEIFKEPEDISDEEVAADMGWSIRRLK